MPPRNDRRPFAFAILMLALAFTGMILLAKTAGEARTMSRDPSCRAIVTLDTELSAPGPVCEIAGGRLASVRRSFAGFATGDGRLVEMHVRGVSTHALGLFRGTRALDDADLVKMRNDVGKHAVLETVLGAPAYLATPSQTYAADADSRWLHYLGVAFVAAALAYFGAWIAVSIVVQRRAKRRL